jgi:fatty acid desaturase
MHLETIDEFRTAVRLIAEEEKAKEPPIYQWICSVTGLKHAQDLRTVAFMAYYFISLYVCWNWSALLPAAIGQNSILDWATYCVIWYSNIYFSFLGSVMTHNTMHCALFRSPTANKIVQLLLTLTYGHPVSSYVPGHNLSHHKYTQSKRDVMNTYLVRSKYHSWNLVSFQPKLTASVMQSDFRYIVFQKERGNWKFVSQAMRELAFLLAVQIALIYTSFSKWVVFFFVPHFFAQYAIVTLSLLQHDGCERFDNKDSTINWNTSRNFTNDFLNFFCLNNGFHTVHHLVPTTHWSLCRVIHEKLVVGRTDERLMWPSMANFVLHQFFLNANPWNENKKRRMYDGRIDVEPKSKTDPVPVIEKASVSTVGSISMKHRKPAAMRSNTPPTVRSTTTTTVTTSKVHVVKKNADLLYEEWLSFPEDFDTDTVPDTKQELGASIGLLLIKLLISPLYSVEPGLRLV